MIPKVCFGNRRTQIIGVEEKVIDIHNTGTDDVALVHQNHPTRCVRSSSCIRSPIVRREDTMPRLSLRIFDARQVSLVVAPFVCERSDRSSDTRRKFHLVRYAVYSSIRDKVLH